jgi:hypothetical protein
MHATAQTYKRTIQLASWPPAFFLPNTEYVLKDPANNRITRWETDSQARVMNDVNPAGVAGVVAQMFVNSAGQPLTQRD